MDVRRLVNASRERLGRARHLPAELAERRRASRLWSVAERGLLPPPPSAFGAYGHGVLLMTPIRVEGPEFIYLSSGVRVHEQSWLMTRQLPDRPPPRLSVGNMTSFTRFTKIVCAGEVTIGADCIFGDFLYVADTHYRFDDPYVPIANQPLADPKPVRIGDGVHIGPRSIIGPGVTIGDNAYLGAGCVVTSDIPARCVAVGSPARILRHYDDVAGEWKAGPPPSVTM